MLESHKIKRRIRSGAVSAVMLSDPADTHEALQAVIGLAGESEDSLAQRLAQAHAHELRYVATWGQWFQWNGRHWERDTTLNHIHMSRQICHDVAVELTASGELDEKKLPQVVRALKSAKTIYAVANLARADRRLAASIEQWDANAWRLNTPGGEVCLRTGELLPSNPQSYATKITAVAPSGDGCPTWLKFLDRVTGSDAELVAYLQRVCGYALLGVVLEHALVFLYGTGGNGKSVFVNTVSAILGSYAQAAPMTTFAESAGNQHPTDLAMLRGARLVTATETEEGQRWAAAKIKLLTGGDVVSARFMRQDFFEFKPQFTLVISGNHKPGLRSVDEAMRRRLHLVPFTQTIPAKERDPNLPNALKAEWPAILTWMIEGCLAWRSMGLKPPPVVASATEDYLGDEDVMGQWLEEATEPAFEAFETTTALHDDYRAWAERTGERFLGTKRFSQALEERGLQRHRKGTGKGFTGRRLKPFNQRPWSRGKQASLDEVE